MLEGKQNRRMEENIFAMVPPDPEAKLKVKLHKSRFPGNLPPTGSTFGLLGTSSKVLNLEGRTDEVVLGHNPYGDHKSWGPQVGIRKKGKTMREKSLENKESHPFHLPVVHSSHNLRRHSPHKDKLPLINQAPLLGIRGPSDFIKRNKENAKHLTASQSQAIIIRNKSVKKIDNLNASSTGEIPAYLLRRKQEIHQERAAAAAQVEEQEKRNKSLETTSLPYFELPQEEQEELKRNLRQRWTEVNKEYQAIIHRKVFGMNLKAHKETLEEEMARLETYIKRLDKPHIFIDTKDTTERVSKKNLQAYKSSIKL